ncbi:site-specific DNA-methyltransferase [Fretibacterium sp. OH1220_COT-178]|nr:site-specific DNA-methyltransferase [Fretibacterium sp. OH1220_COT-178]
MPNLSQIKRQRMLDFLETLRKEHTDDESIRAFTEIENHLRDKKYGLVWEEHSERVDEMLEENIPIFTEDADKKITAAADGVYNFILEGDNLQSLYLLEKTHKGLIDVIYIDPPYNRGKDDFVYDDDFIDRNDTFRHSKWISFMTKRLAIARELLSEKGLIFISIDDNEVASLKMIMDEIFGENLFINMFVWQRNSSGKTEKDKFTINTEYLLLYARSDKFVLNSVYKPLADSSVKMYNKDDKDGRGKYATVSLQKPRDPGPETTYDYVDNTGKVWPCPPKGWRMTYAKIKALEDDGRLVLTGKSLRVKDYWNERESEGKRIDTLWNDLPENNVGSAELEKAIGLQDVFNNPKPVDLIRRCIEIGGKNITVLDFFAGSGTTAQAVLASNAKDGGNRTFIICTNNEVSEKKQIAHFVEKGHIEAPPRKGTKKEPEWKEKWAAFKATQEYADAIATEEYQSLGICHSVTYPRVSTVITGIRTDGSQYSDELPANLKYFKCDWTPRKPEEYLLSNALCLHIREMIELQNGTEVDNRKNVLLLNKADFRKYVMDEAVYAQIENIWVNQNIFFNSAEMEKLNALGFKYIPREFFGQELREVAE